MFARTHVLVLTALSLAACTMTAGGGGAPAEGATAADTAAVNALRDAEVAAIANGDTTLAYLADDAHLMSPNEPAIHGIAGARSWMAGFLSQYRGSVVYTNTSVVFAGDIAVETYAGTLTLTPVAGGDSMTESLKGIHIYRRDAAGTWKMSQDIWNADAPPPAAPAPAGGQ